MPPAKAFKACKACRLLKRRCSRQRPTCALCSRLGKKCEYESTGLNDRAADSAGHNQRSHERMANSDIVERERHVSVPSQVQPLTITFFLDSDQFKPVHQCHLKAANSQFLGQRLQFAIDEPRTIIDIYVLNTHQWLPILSIKRLWQDHHSWELENDDDFSLLLKALRLLNRRQHVLTGADTITQPAKSDYSIVRTCSFSAESEGFITLRLVQVLVLLALYEYGHGIYPAAYLTIGRAVRLGVMIGLHLSAKSKQLFERAETWTLCEEQRRTWWAIVLLDRAVVLGSPHLPMSAPDPNFEQLLPSHDDGWTYGMIGSNEALLSDCFSANTALGSFAKVCQAVHVLGKVIHHVQGRRTATERTILLEEALRLHRALVALDASINASSSTDAILKGSDPQVVSARAICSSARFVLYNEYACNDPGEAVHILGRVALETEVQGTFLEGIKSLALETVPNMARRVKQSLNLNATHSPVLASCLYHAATECAWFIKEDRDPAMYVALSDITEALRALRGQWSVTKKYLELRETNHGLGQYVLATDEL